MVLLLMLVLMMMLLLLLFLLFSQLIAAWLWQYWSHEKSHYECLNAYPWGLLQKDSWLPHCSLEVIEICCIEIPTNTSALNGKRHLCERGSHWQLMMSITTLQINFSLVDCVLSNLNVITFMLQFEVLAGFAANKNKI